MVAKGMVAVMKVIPGLMKPIAIGALKNPATVEVRRDVVLMGSLRTAMGLQGVVGRVIHKGVLTHHLMKNLVVVVQVVVLATQDATSMNMPSVLGIPWLL